MSGFLLSASISGSALTIGLTLDLAGRAQSSVLDYTAVALALYWVVVASLYFRARLAHRHGKVGDSARPGSDEAR